MASIFDENGGRAEPKDARQAVRMLRTEVATLSAVLHGVLAFGFPRIGRTDEDKAEYDRWYKDRWEQVISAQEALRLTDKIRDEPPAPELAPPPEVTGRITYEVRVKCPHCGKNLDLNSYPYDGGETEYFDFSDALGGAVFGGKERPAKWSGIKIPFRCCSCKQNFVLTKLEI